MSVVLATATPTGNTPFTPLKRRLCPAPALAPAGAEAAPAAPLMAWAGRFQKKYHAATASSNTSIAQNQPLRRRCPPSCASSGGLASGGGLNGVFMVRGMVANRYPLALLRAAFLRHGQAALRLFYPVHTNG